MALVVVVELASSGERSGGPLPNAASGAGLMGGSPGESLSAALAFAPYERRGPFGTATHPVHHVGTFYYPVDYARQRPDRRLPGSRELQVLMML